MLPNVDRLAPDLPSRMRALMDALLLAAALALALPSDVSMAVLWAVSVAWVAALATLRIYQPGRAATVGAQVGLRLIVSGGTALVAAVYSDIFQVEQRGAGVLMTVLGGLSLSSLLGAVMSTWVKHTAIPVMVLGSGPMVRTLVLQLAATVPPRRVVHTMPLPSDSTRDASHPHSLWTLQHLQEVLTTTPVAEVFIAGNPLRQAKEMRQVVKLCEVLGMPFALPAHTLPLERARPENVTGLTAGFMHYVSEDSRPAARAFKRLFDLVSSAVALVVLSPLLLGVAAAIKLTSKGPVFFKQQRVGLHGRMFGMLKFRSMVVDAEAQLAKLQHLNEQKGPVFKMEKDPRVTAIGRFIRRYSVDELPQLINILVGDMSVVGPRPPVPSEVKKYLPWQRRRLSVRPGLTCFWQVSGRNRITFDQWMLMDMRYIDQWSFLTDIKLILATFPAVFTARGAS